MRPPPSEPGPPIDPAVKIIDDQFLSELFDPTSYLREAARLHRLPGGFAFAGPLSKAIEAPQIRVADVDGVLIGSLAGSYCDSRSSQEAAGIALVGQSSVSGLQHFDPSCRLASADQTHALRPGHLSNR